MFDYRGLYDPIILMLYIGAFVLAWRAETLEELEADVGVPLSRQKSDKSEQIEQIRSLTRITTLRALLA